MTALAPFILLAPIPLLLLWEKARDRIAERLDNQGD